MGRGKGEERRPKRVKNKNDLTSEGSEEGEKRDGLGKHEPPSTSEHRKHPSETPEKNNFFFGKTECSGKQKKTIIVSL